MSKGSNEEKHILVHLYTEGQTLLTLRIKFSKLHERGIQSQRDLENGVQQLPLNDIFTELK